VLHALLYYILSNKFINENTTSYSLNKSDIIIKVLADDFQALISNDKDYIQSLDYGNKNEAVKNLKLFWRIP